MFYMAGFIDHLCLCFIPGFYIHKAGQTVALIIDTVMELSDEIIAPSPLTPRTS